MYVEVARDIPLSPLSSASCNSSVKNLSMPELSASERFMKLNQLALRNIVIITTSRHKTTPYRYPGSYTLCELGLTLATQWHLHRSVFREMTRSPSECCTL